MGLTIAPAELARWKSQGLIRTDTPAKPFMPLLERPSGSGEPRWRVRLELPGLVVISRANSREHWTKRHQRNKREAEALTAAWQAAGLIVWRVPLPTVVTFTRIGGKPMDTDNLAGAFKAIRDKLADLIGVDDGNPSMTWRTRQRPSAGRLVIVSIRPRG